MLVPSDGEQNPLAGPPGDPQALLDHADMLEQHAAALTTLAASLDTTTSSVRQQANWGGDAAEGYSTFSGNTSAAVQRMVDPLNQVAATMRDYASTLATHQNAVRYAVTDAQVQAGGGGATPSDPTAAKLAAASDARDAVDAAEEEHASTVDKIKERVQVILDGVHLPWDAGAGAAFTIFSEVPADKAFEAAEELAKEKLPDLNVQWQSLLDNLSVDADNPGWEQTVKALQKVPDNTVEEFLNPLEKQATMLKQIGWLGDGLGIIGDIGTIWTPEDKGNLGLLDRAMAGINASTSTIKIFDLTRFLDNAEKENPLEGESAAADAADAADAAKAAEAGAEANAEAATGADLAADAGADATAGVAADAGLEASAEGALAAANSVDEVPVVGEAVLALDAATGAYLAGDYADHHWTGLTQVLAAGGPPGWGLITAGDLTKGSFHAAGDIDGGAIKAAGDIGSSAWNGTAQIGSSLWNGNVNGALDGLGQIGSGTVQGIGDIGDGIWNAGGDIGSSVMNGFSDVGSGISHDLSDLGGLL